MKLKSVLIGVLLITLAACAELTTPTIAPAKTAPTAAVTLFHP